MRLVETEDFAAGGRGRHMSENAFAYTDGGVTAAQGFRASGVHAGFRRNTSKNDLALVVADAPCAAAATFTQNVFCAAPVRFSRAQLAASSGNEHCGSMRAVVINSGNANAATGEAGVDLCREEAALVSDVVGCAPDEVLVASTGVIGVPLTMAPFKQGVPQAVAALSKDGGHAAAQAIMTTDTRPKECAVTIDGARLGCAGATFVVGGMAKGSGMIMPNMATMIAVITTDAPVKAPDLYALLKHAVDLSFNKVTVDSDTSTNDTCFMLASGAACPDAQPVEPGTQAFAVLQEAVCAVCTSLARQMARDGEGATKLVDVVVTGAANSEDADAAARTIANSPLVKTAIAGHDANWGRIAGAVGRSGAQFRQEDVDIDIMGLPVCRGGLAQTFDEDEALRLFDELDEIVIAVDLGAGEASTTVWTCDFTHDYISINGDYRT